MPASEVPPSFLLKNVICAGVGRLSSIVHATIVPFRGILSGALYLPTFTCMPVVSDTTSHGELGQLGTGPVAAVAPVAPVAPLTPLAPLRLVEPVLPEPGARRTCAPTSVSIPKASVGTSSITA